MRKKRSFKAGCGMLLVWAMAIVSALVMVLLLTAGWLWAWAHPPCERSDGIVYTQRRGNDLTFDLVRPKSSNGAAVLVLMSGSWKSRPTSFDSWMAAPFLRRGITVFAVSHLSQPEAPVQEIVEDMHRAVRFIRSRAGDYGVDPDRIGVSGASSGGHLSLMLATCGGPGDPAAPDPVDRESSAVQAAAIFFPVTNLVDLGSSRENAGDGGPPKHFRDAFGDEGRDIAGQWPALARELSPVFRANAGQAPVLIFHGDADTLTPLEQSIWFREASEKAGATSVEIVVRRGARHGWLTMPLDLVRCADWYCGRFFPKA